MIFLLTTLECFGVTPNTCLGIFLKVAWSIHGFASDQTAVLTFLPGLSAAWMKLQQHITMAETYESNFAIPKSL